MEVINGKESDIAKKLHDMAAGFGPDVSILATVKDVDTNECTCTLVDEDGQDFPEVRLRPITGVNKSILMIPSIGSYVLAVRIEGDDDFMIVACDQIDSIEVLSGQTKIEIGDDIKINGGALGGLVKIQELTDKINALIQIFNTHTHPVPNGVSSVTATKMQSLNVADYEDSKIKH